MKRRTFLASILALPALKYIPEPHDDWIIKLRQERLELMECSFSKEAMEDIKNWNVDQVDEETRRAILIGGYDAKTQFSKNAVLDSVSRVDI